ncbi:hypothetical protein [Paenibacillus thiaminolyticus]|uniref:Lipoprotein n=1 Tax=Paenibacillus thiaminolyticus TaxID=49283 RepID=A0A3A3GTH1_PANTH|nr:hypothetical protein [Paenibacillus thiaminolyticus]RJG26876.1 hypothetical protein DQX05_02305 [Paenibacillus thiaminolyticus]
MKKKYFLLLFIFSTILVSCTTQKEAIPQPGDSGDPSIALRIVVIGDDQIEGIDSVNFVKTTLQDLVKDENQQFDGLIISKEYFEEAAKKQYKDFFKNIKYPVFFLGTENILTAVFHEDELSLEDAKIGGWGPYASGFVRVEDGYNEWALYLPNNSTNNDKEKNIILRICNILQKYKKDKKE